MSRTVCGLGHAWDQVGNRTGHCRDGHVECWNPGVLRDKHGEPRFRSFVDKYGATVWRSAKERPEGTWGR